VASITVGCAANVVRRFATGCYTIVTRDTISDETRMIRCATRSTATRGWTPGVRVMAGIAFRGGWYMGSTLARGSDAVMTTGTRTQDFGVINGQCRRPV
jgi:hypothetical protein